MNQKINRNLYKKKTNETALDNDCICGNPEVTSKDGTLVCINCGTVIGVDMVSNEQRAYSVDEVNKRKRTEKKWRDIGPRTYIGKERVDSKGNVMDPKGKTLFNRLDKIQISLVDSLERNKWEAKPKLNLLASKLNIPEYIKETAWRIYVECAKKKLTMGRSIIGFVAGSLYAAIRIHELPRLLDEVCDIQLIPRRTVHQSLGLLIKEVLPGLGYKYKPITSQQLVYRFGSDLELPMEIQKTAADMLGLVKKRGKEQGLNMIGKDPRGLAASAIYIASKASVNRQNHRTQALIAEVAKITEVTLRSRAKDIRKCLK